VDAYRTPVLYILEDLMSTVVKGRFYSQQLRIAPDPTDKDFVFEIEAVEKKKTVKGELYVYVKYLYYPGDSCILHIFII
jgi:hypothetical protein